MTICSTQLEHPILRSAARAIVFLILFILPSVALCSENTIVISNSTFYQNGRPIFYTGAFMYWEEDTQFARRGEWSSNRRYAEVIDKAMYEELGFNTWHPINFMSLFHPRSRRRDDENERKTKAREETRRR